jgi:predicted transcriptional regulator
MLIEIKPTAIKTLTCRTDVEAFRRIRTLSESFNCSQSVLIRLAIADLLGKQKKIEAKNLAELMEDNNYGY